MAVFLFILFHSSVENPFLLHALFNTLKAVSFPLISLFSTVSTVLRLFPLFRMVL